MKKISVLLFPNLLYSCLRFFRQVFNLLQFQYLIVIFVSFVFHPCLLILLYLKVFQKPSVRFNINQKQLIKGLFLHELLIKEDLLGFDLLDINSQRFHLFHCSLIDNFYHSELLLDLVEFLRIYLFWLLKLWLI